jgi:hypothetical protein
MLETTNAETLFLREQVRNLTAEIKALREQISVLTAQHAVPAPQPAPKKSVKNKKPVAKAARLSEKRPDPVVSKKTPLPSNSTTTKDKSGALGTVFGIRHPERAIPAAPATETNDDDDQTPFTTVVHGRRSSRTSPVTPPKSDTPDSLRCPATPSKKRPLDDTSSSIENDIADLDEDDSAPATNGPSGRIPPIVLHKQEDYRKIASAFKINGVLIKEAKTRAGGVSIAFQTPNDYRKAQDLLSRGNIPHHTYKTADEKTTNVVLRGVPNSQGIEDDIKEELVGRGLKVISVARMKNLRTRLPMPLLLVKLERSENTKEIFAIESVLNIKITVEKAKAKTITGQCYRCQRFGHAQSSCKGEIRCVKCTTSGHWSRDCPKAKDIKAQCCNCKGLHSANYLGCPAHPKNRQPTTKNTRTPAHPPTKPVMEGVSWANIAAPVPPPATAAPAVPAPAAAAPAPTISAPVTTAPTHSHTPTGQQTTSTGITREEWALAFQLVQLLRNFKFQ